jgi:excisionase family DNA binding protein
MALDDGSRRLRSQQGAPRLVEKITGEFDELTAKIPALLPERPFTKPQPYLSTPACAGDHRTEGNSQMKISDGRIKSRRKRQSTENTRRRRSGCLAYSISRLAKLVGAGRSKLYGEIAAGRLKASKLGRRTIVTRENANAWLRELPTMQTLIRNAISDDRTE